VSLRPVATPLTRSDWLDWTAARGDEPALFTRPGKKPSAGIVIIEPDKRVWAFEPTNHFAGYTLTFPKGTVEAGWSLAATAAREAFEETGLLVEVGTFLADVERTLSVARFYLGRRRGGSPPTWVGRHSP
jgi:8-oxo-dGTP pyrophosphatase MutT (NUDIX family)